MTFILFKENSHKVLLIKIPFTFAAKLEMGL